jgi:hypothetical protein
MSTFDEITAVVKPILDAVDLRAAQTDAYLRAVEAEALGLRQDLATAQARVAELEAQLAPPLKPALTGLVTTDPDNYAGVPYTEFVSTKPLWRTCNPAPDSFDFSSVEAMLDRHPDKLFRLRFMAGRHAPEWAKARSGGAIQHVPDTNTGAEGQVPRFWTENYFQDYMAFMAAVAGRFEDDPRVVEVTSNLTTTIYAEPFILNADAATITRYWQAGYRFDLVRTNLLRSVHGMMEMFPTTRVSLAGHGKWERIIDGRINRDWPAERAVYNELIAAYGPRLVLDDHGLGADDPIGVPQPADTATTWYNYMAGCGSTEITYGWQLTPKDFSMTVAAEMAVKMGACFVEFAGFDRIPEPTRRQIHDALLANAAGKV